MSSSRRQEGSENHHETYTNVIVVGVRHAVEVCLPCVGIVFEMRLKCFEVRLRRV